MAQPKGGLEIHRFPVRICLIINPNEKGIVRPREPTESDRSTGLIIAVSFCSWKVLENKIDE